MTALEAPDAPDAPRLTERPRVLVTRAEDVLGERWEDYADRLRELAAQPLAWELTAWRAGEAPPDCDGILVTAGFDIDPARYGQQRSEYTREIDPDRDSFEVELVEWALAADIPVLAICRGHQLFNVAFGGSLIQHLTEREPHRARRGEGDAIDSGWHDVALRPGSRLAAAFGQATLHVNSRHHQAVTADRVAPALVVAASAPDGVVEALEHPDHRWAVSVQWHPERDEMATASRPLFAAFVAACAASPA